MPVINREGWVMRAIGFTFAVVLATPLQAGAQEPAAAPASAANTVTTTPATTAAAAPDQVTCKLRGAETGSHLGGRRECHTQREWQRMRTAEQQQLFRAQVQYGMSPGH